MKTYAWTVRTCEAICVATHSERGDLPWARHRVGQRLLAGLMVKAVAAVFTILAIMGAARATCTSTPMYGTVPPNPVISGPADNFPIGQRIGGWGVEVAVQYVFDARWGGCNWNAWMDKAYAKATWSAIPGITYTEPANGKQYSVYQSGVEGIGYAVGIRDYAAAALDKEVPLNGTVQTYPFAGGSAKGVDTLGFRARIILVATGRVPSGTYTIAPMNIAELWATNNDGLSVPPNTTLSIGRTTVTTLTTGCTVQPTSVSQTVTMPTVMVGASGWQDQTASISIGMECDSGVSVYATMTDAEHPENRSDVLLPSSSSQVKGLGIQFSREGAPEGEYIRFGPDSSAAGNANQWLFCGSGGGQGCGAATGVHSLQLKARYKRIGTSDVLPGRFEALATITFSYQ